MRKVNFFILALVSVMIHNTVAQCRKAKWPEQRSLAEEKIALYGDALKQKKYQAAAAPFQWVLANAPDWHIKLYIDGAKIYDRLAQKEKNPVRKQELVDSLLLIYDKRIENCGDKINVLNRKAFSAYKYEVNNKSKVVALLKLYDSLLNTCKGEISDGNLVAYMTTVKANHVLLDNLSDEKILNSYDRIMAITDRKIKAAEAVEGKESTVEKLKKYKSVIDDLLIDMVKVDCDFVKKNLAPKFKDNPDDIALSKKIFRFMLQGKCTNDPLWLEVGEVILKEEKDFGLIKNMALKYVKKGNSERAESLCKEGLKVAAKNEDIADMLIYLGGLEARKRNKTKARQYFQQASATNKSERRGYESIGDLYYGSFEECSKKQKMAEDRLVYIAAYKMYQLAGDSKKMAQSKAQFPSKEEIFLLNWKVGETKPIDCWINESVTLSTRD